MKGKVKVKEFATLLDNLKGGLSKDDLPVIFTAPYKTEIN
jgi:hypothetical protein